VKFGIDVAPIGDLADPSAIVQLATAAEAAGWDGLSIWDGLSAWDNARNASAPLADPFVALGAVAASTERLRLILSALVLPRRRPHLVAQACGSLDRLSDGRLVLGAVIGAERSEFEAFGEDPDVVARAALLDESLDLIDLYLRGETVEHDGPALVARGATIGPRPIQQPRPPIWLGGRRPRALRRAARWDGWLAVGIGDIDSVSMAVSPTRLAESLALIRAERAHLGSADEPFDVALLGYSDPALPDTPADYAQAGATWWLESFSLAREPFDSLLARAEAGPPR
jgi:alkanesulfonate monooxygenase SsuD/methylene tetrahydromethanopterin reductase-like flavin-dependent oxidoreductase (luciferase family)